MTTKKINLLSMVIILFFTVIIFPFQKAIALTITPVRLEISGDPGQILSQEMTLINERDTVETYYASYANFEAQGETGSPAFVDAKDDLGTWMTAPNTIVLAPKTSKIVPIKITIPKDADPGGHFAAIFWGTIPPNTGSNSVSIGAKTGMLVLLRVNGDVNEKGGLVEFATKNKQKFYTALPVSFYYRFQNAGGDRIKPIGDIKMKDIFGITEAKVAGNPVDGNILPNSTRKFETVWQGKDGPTPPEEKDQGGFFGKVRYEWRNFALGHYNAKISLNYGTKNEVAFKAFGFWIFPWHLLLVIIIGLGLIILLGHRELLKYNQWVISQAVKQLKNAHATIKKTINKSKV